MYHGDIIGLLSQYSKPTTVEGEGGGNVQQRFDADTVQESRFCYIIDIVCEGDTIKFTMKLWSTRPVGWIVNSTKIPRNYS